MAGLERFHGYVKNLNHQAGILAEAAVSLCKSFEAEADRMTCEDGAWRLKSIHATVIEDLRQARSQEVLADYAYTKASPSFPIAEFITKTIMAAATGGRLGRNILNHAFDTHAHKQLPFGMVMVRVGPKGIPDDVRVVSVSELARKSNRLESQVVHELQRRGCLLFSEKAFCALIERLIRDVREGRLALPISTEKLSQMKPLSCVKPVLVKPEYIIVSPPR